MTTLPRVGKQPAGHAPAGGAVVVAVDGHTPAAVLDEAADLAEALHAQLMVVHVDPTRGVSGTRHDGTPLVLPIDPDLPADIHQPVLDAVQAMITARLSGRPVNWSLRTTVGYRVTGIVHIADVVGARVIVVGTRGSGMHQGLHRLFDGSVSTKLARHQSRPVLIVPETSAPKP
jgi:nucleotide-binding universal stress UspA family protein